MLMIVVKVFAHTYLTTYTKYFLLRVKLDISHQMPRAHGPEIRLISRKLPNVYQILTTRPLQKGNNATKAQDVKARRCP